MKNQRRAQRRFRNAVEVANQLWIIKTYGSVARYPAQLRKRHGMSCGKSRCFMCVNPRRLTGELTVPELRAKEAFNYELEMLNTDD